MRRDDPDVLHLGPPRVLPAPAATVVAALSPLLTEERLARIHEVVRSRTKRFIPVLENLHDPHNASAVLRSADAFGVQNVAMVRPDGEFLAARTVAQGAHRWLDIHLFREVAACVAWLRAGGYRILVARMDGEASPEALGAGPTAVVFGNEHAGTSSEIAALADGTYAIPMGGFVESLNVSVAAAISMFVGTRGAVGDLDAGEQELLTARYLLSSVRDAERVVEEFVKRA